MHTSVTAQLAEFICETRQSSLPDAALDVARTALIDCSAAMLAGSNSASTMIVLSQLDTLNVCKEAHVVFGANMASAIEAALVNGVAAHALEYDDVGLLGHPSAVLLPAILAYGEYYGVAGAALLRAYIVGYEVWDRLIEREPNSYHTKGWHTTSVLGAVAAAAAVANLAVLDRWQCANALGLATAMSSGIRAHFGTMTKPFQAGWAASVAVRAVKLAAAGFTASVTALEHAGGLLRALSPDGAVDLTSPVQGLGSIWSIVDRGLRFRKYPICYGGARVIDATLELRKWHRIDIEAIQRVNVLTGENQTRMMRFHDPKSADEARFSLEFAVACALAIGRVGPYETSDDFIHRPDIQQLMKRVYITSHKGVSSDDIRFGSFDQVEIVLGSGDVICSGPVSFAHGHPSVPLTGDEIKEKFTSAARYGGWQGGVEALLERLQKVEMLSSLGELF